MANLSAPQSEEERQQEEKNNSVVNPSFVCDEEFQEFRREYFGRFILVALSVAITFLLAWIILALVGCPRCDESALQPLNETPSGTVAWTRNLEVAERAITSRRYAKDIFNRMRTQTTVKRVQLELDDNIEGYMDCFYIRNNVGTKKPSLVIVCPLKTPTKTNANDVEVYRKSSVLADGTLISGTVYTVSANGELQVRQEIQSTSTHLEHVGKKSDSDTASSSTVIPAAAKPSAFGTSSNFSKGPVDVESFIRRKLGKLTATEIDKIKGYPPTNHAVGKLIESVVMGRKVAREPIPQILAPAAASEFDETGMTVTSKRENLVNLNTAGVLKLVNEANNASDFETKDNDSALEGNRAGKLTFTALKATMHEKKAVALSEATGTTNGTPQDLEISTTADIEEAAASEITTVVSTSDAEKPVDFDAKDTEVKGKQADRADRLQSVPIPKPVYEPLWKYLNAPPEIQTIRKLNEKYVANNFGSDSTVAG